MSNATAAYSSISPPPRPRRRCAPLCRRYVAAEIDRLVVGNQQIHAIKIVREHTGLGLKESKDVIDAWAALRPLSPAGSLSLSITHLGR